MRIIAGRLRGRPLFAPKGAHTRPTTDRVREALFSILGPLDARTVADCHAGTGALGLEAISRGAARVVLIENDAAACRALRRNVESLGVEREVTLLALPLERCRARLSPFAPFDLVLSDPPWPIATKAAQRVATVFSELLSPTGLLVLGHRKKEPVALGDDAPFALEQCRSWGDSAFSFFGRRALGTSEPPGS